MASKRRISYQWQLFIPFIATIWLLIFGMAFWQNYNEREYRKASLEAQLQLINERIISYYENEKDPIEFFRFLSKYYIDNPLYDKIRITVYRNDSLYYHVNEVITLSDESRRNVMGVTDNIHQENSAFAPIDDSDTDEDLKNNNFFFRTDLSSDSVLRTSTVLPFDADIIEASLPQRSIWIIVFSIAICLTVLANFSTRF
ncbi:MAG: hypothetical protein K2J10_04975 [Muribaculaceae bacterium]|nr:hypothetical protein [Muribaculaceae bacterium]